MLRHIPLDQLAVFAAAARHVSFTRAAQDLGVTQSAVSQQVRQLEERLGRQLFRRLPRGLALTDDGRALLPLVGEVLERLTGGLAELFGPAGRRRLQVKATLGWARFFLAPRLPGFFAAHPDLELRVSTALWAGGGPEPDVELEVRYGSGRWPGLIAEQLTWDLLVPVAAPLLAQRVRRPGDLLEQPLLTTVGFREGWPAFLAAAGVAGVPPSAREFDTAVLALALAEAGAGVALARSCFLGEALDQGRLAAPLGLALESAEPFWLVRAEGRPLSEPAERFRRWLLAETETARRQDEWRFARFTRLPAYAPPGGS